MRGVASVRNCSNLANTVSALRYVLVTTSTLSLKAFGPPGHGVVVVGAAVVEPEASGTLLPPPALPVLPPLPGAGGVVAVAPAPPPEQAPHVAAQFFAAFSSVGSLQSMSAEPAAVSPWPQVERLMPSASTSSANFESSSAHASCSPLGATPATSLAATTSAELRSLRRATTSMRTSDGSGTVLSRSLEKVPKYSASANWTADRSSTDANP
mmetsp:Transcript_5371/g.15946  ORF Transcript_5371/g.15946 Transcript_5371/m.15946 type:complete len:211 (+) Transcript_5371:162-794(+)